jgi:hypothetical protein
MGFLKGATVPLELANIQPSFGGMLVSGGTDSQNLLVSPFF